MHPLRQTLEKWPAPLESVDLHDGATDVVNQPMCDLLADLAGVPPLTPQEIGAPRTRVDVVPALLQVLDGAPRSRADLPADLVYIASRVGDRVLATAHMAGSAADDDHDTACLRVQELVDLCQAALAAGGAAERAAQVSDRADRLLGEAVEALPDAYPYWQGSAHLL